MSLAEIPQAGATFQLPTSFSLLAHFTFGMTGAMAALRRGYDIIGVVFLAVVTAGGGGLIRDGLLISSGPPVILTNQDLLLAVLAAALVTRFLYRHVARLRRAVAVVDALGLGAFAVIGVQVSLSAGLSIPGAILGGMVTAVGGGLLRDIMVREEPLLFKPGQFYALAAMAGCGLYVALIHSPWAPPERAALITIAVVFAVRMLAIRYNWQTRALYREPTSPPPPPEGTRSS